LTPMVKKPRIVRIRWHYVRGFAPDGFYHFAI
jgi:hypothetical protein